VKQLATVGAAAGRAPRQSRRHWATSCLLARSARLRGLQCARSCGDSEPTLLLDVFWANLGARTANRPALSKSRGNFTPVLPLQCAAPHAFCLVLIACALFVSLLVAARFSPCVVTFSRVHVCASVVLMLRARSAFLLRVHARPLSLSLSLSPPRPNATHSIM
jgi:hypothetical protein